MLILTRKVNERIMIGDEIEVSVVEIRGDQVKLGIIAPRSVKVHRREVFEAIQDENREAAESASSTLPNFEELGRMLPGGAPQESRERDDEGGG